MRGAAGRRETVGLTTRWISQLLFAGRRRSTDGVTPTRATGEKYGETTFADPVNKKYPIATFRSESIHPGSLPPPLAGRLLSTRPGRRRAD